MPTSHVLSAILFVALTGVSSAAEPSTCSLEVRVVQEDGSPAPEGVLIAVSREGDPQAQKTDESGSPLLFEGLPCGEVTVRRSNGGGMREPMILVLVPDIPHSAEVTVPDSRPVDVHVVDPQGNPVRAGWVRFQEKKPAGDHGFRHSSILHSTSDHKRFFISRRMTRVDFDPQGKVRSARVNGAAVELPTIIPAGAEAVEVVFEVAPHTILSGRVVDQDGKGVSGVELRASGNQVHSGADGRFTISVEKPSHRVKASLPLWTFEPKSFRADTEGERVFVGRKLTLETVELRGRVVESGTDTPVKGMQILMVSKCRIQRDPLTARTSANEDGTFRVACMPDCESRLTVFDPSPGKFIRWSTSLAGDGCGTEVLAEMERGGNLTIRVADTNGRPLEDLPLFHSKRTDETDGAGVSRITGLPPGELPVSLHYHACLPECAHLALTDTEGQGFPVARIEGPEHEAELNLVVVTGGEICVRATDPEGAEALLTRLAVHRVPDGLELRSYFMLPESRDEPGRFCSGPLPAGEYFVLMSGRTLAQTWWSGAEPWATRRPVKVEAGAITELGPMVMQRKERL